MKSFRESASELFLSVAKLNAVADAIDIITKAAQESQGHADVILSLHGNDSFHLTPKLHYSLILIDY